MNSQRCMSFPRPRIIRPKERSLCFWIVHVVSNPRLPKSQHAHVKKLSVAIIGAGMGGLATAAALQAGRY